MDALPPLLVVTVVEPRNVCPWPKPDGSATRLLKNWIRNVVFATLVSDPCDIAARAAARRPGDVGRSLRVIGRSVQHDALLSVGIDAVREDRVARPGLDKDAGRHVEGNRVALAAGRPADGVVRRVGR